MKITIFASIFHPEMVTVNEVSKNLAERGHSVSVITGIPNAPRGKIFEGYGFFKRLNENWGNVKIIRSWQIPRGNAGPVRLVINYFSFVLFGSLASVRMARNPPDVIFVNAVSPITVALPAIFFSKITKAPVVMWIHDLWPESVTASGMVKNKLTIKIVGGLVRFIYKRCDLLLIQSQAMRPSVALRNSGQKGNIKYFPNPIAKHYEPLGKSQKIELLAQVPENAFIIMFAGSIGASQDMPTILEAAKILCHITNIHWIIVGDGRKYNASVDIAKKLSLKDCVHFIGSHPSSDMPVFFSKADVMLVTLRDEPIFRLTVPLKTQTYLACGKPVICNVAGEATRIINEAAAGFTLPPENPKALAEAVHEAYKMRGVELDNMGRNARRYFEANYSHDKIMDGLEKELVKLASDRNGN